MAANWHGPAAPLRFAELPCFSVEYPAAGARCHSVMFPGAPHTCKPAAMSHQMCGSSVKFDSEASPSRRFRRMAGSPA